MVRPWSIANVIRDEIPAPREYIELQYKGPNPLAVYQRIDLLLRKIWEIKGTQLYEPDFRWDTTSDPRPFFINVFAERAMDKWTAWRVDIKMQGAEPSDPYKDGVLRIEIHGWIETKFSSELFTPINNAIFRIFYWPYMVAYYAPRRRRYIEWHRRRIERLVEEIRGILNIPSKPIP